MARYSDRYTSGLSETSSRSHSRSVSWKASSVTGDLKSVPVMATDIRPSCGVRVRSIGWVLTAKR